MKIGIRYRLFLALLLANAVAVAGMFLIMQWSINRGFLRYVNTVEQERLETLAAELEGAYAAEGNWDFLRDSPVRWLRQASRPDLPPDLVPPPPRRRENPEFGGRREREPHPRRFELRLSLLDAERRPVFGPEPRPGEEILRPLTVAGETVGYLGLAPRQGLADVHQLRFVKDQRLALALIAATLLLVSILVGLPLAARLVRPIRTLAAATRRLSAGEYGTRVVATSRDELGQLGADFNALALALEQTEQARRNWVADISHELRTPLAVLRGEIEALQDGVRPLSPAALASLHGEVLHLGRLVDDLYQLSLADVGALSYRKEPLALVPLLRQVVELARPEFARKKIALALSLPGDGIVLQADGERLRQLFANLLANSLRYTDAGGRLEVALQRGRGEVTVVLRDSAPGVPEEELERLFDRLYRVEGSRSRATGGAGLGLAICRSIVEAHQGTIAAHPSPLGGVEVSVTLPVQGGGR